jgi:hypothetical protein
VLFQQPAQQIAVLRDREASTRSRVLAQHGLVVLRDDAVIRLLAPRAAIELAAELIAATMPAVAPGPIARSL